MKLFALYNQKLKKFLIHPKIGLWQTDSENEAKDMLKACHDYIKSIGQEALIPFFVIKEVNQDLIQTSPNTSNSPVNS